MKINKNIYSVFTAMLFFALNFTATISFSQAHADSTSMKNCSMKKNCCMMMDGKMMQMKDGKMTALESDVTMENGTKCMVNGECVMKDGKKMKMKEGECMDMNGNVETCKMSGKDSKCMNDKKCCSKQTVKAAYACPMHPEVASDKAGKCSKCGMDLIEKK